MRIKRRDELSYSDYKEKVLKIWRYLYSKKVRVAYRILKIIIILAVGIFIGLLITKFFGTLDNPSPKLLNFAYKTLGGQGFGFQVFVRGLLAENIKIPFNYLSGQFSKPDKLYIDVAFQDWQKIAYKREQALERKYLIASDDDWVNAVVSGGNKKVSARIRLKGDLTDHWITDKWSLRIDLKGDETIYGMEQFSIQNPHTRGWLNEFIYQEALRKEGVLGLRYNFVEVVINGKNNGIYALEEHFDKRLLENQERREGVIIRFDESMIGLEVVSQEDLLPVLISEKDVYPFSSIDSYQTQTILENAEISSEFYTARDLLENFRKGKLKTSEVFDTDLLARYFAITTLMGGEHASQWNNIRFYYNPVTSKLEPIGFDSNSGLITQRQMDSYFPGYLGNKDGEKLENFPKIIFTDPIFFEKYIEELERMSKKEYLDEFFGEIDKEINRKIRILHKDAPYYHFDRQVFYENQKFIQKTINPVKGFNAYYQGVLEGKIILEIGNINPLPIVIDGLDYKGVVFDGSGLLQPFLDKVKYQKFEFKIPLGFSYDESMLPGVVVMYRILGSGSIKNETIIPWSYVDEEFLGKDFFRQERIFEPKDFLEINEEEKTINIKKGSWLLNESLIIPAGYSVTGDSMSIELADGAVLVSYSDMNLKNAKIYSSDNTGQGLVIFNSKVNLENVEFRNLRNAEKEGWQLTGALTFYETDLNFNNVLISNMHAEDSINIIRSNFYMNNLKIESGSSDCLDIDFGSGEIRDSEFIECVNDGLDISGANIKINNIKSINNGDKGISIGEKGKAEMRDVVISGSYIGVASKDLSEVEVINLEISNCKYGLTAYQKKSEYGAGKLSVRDLELKGNDNDYILEEGSEIIIDDEMILDTKKDVYKELYPEG